MNFYDKCTNTSLLKCLAKYNLLVDDKEGLNKLPSTIRDYIYTALYCGKYSLQIISCLLEKVILFF